MESASTLFEQFVPTKSSLSERTELIKILYELYRIQPERTREENKKRYIEYLRLHHPEVLRKNGFSKERYNSYKSEFRKAKLSFDKKLIIPLTARYFAIKLSVFTGQEGIETLQYMISVSRDIGHRNGNIAAYILGSIKTRE